MKFPSRFKSISGMGEMWRRAAAACAMLFVGAAAQGQIDASNWASATSPVFGTSEAGVYAGAELFAGPNKLGSYFSGVLPNGRKVTPAGVVAQVGMNPLGCVLTPDGRYLITTNDDERDGGIASLLAGSINVGGYSMSVVRTADMKVVSQIACGPVYIGLQAKSAGSGCLVYASGGPSNSVRIFTVSDAGAIAVSAAIPILPITPKNQGYVSSLTNATDVSTTYINSAGVINVPGNAMSGGAAITFPAGSALSPDGRYLYVACNGDNSLAVIDTSANRVVKQIAVGYFPYGVSVNAAGTRVFVSNWGVTEYKFANPTYDAAKNLTNLRSTPNNLPDGFYVPPTSTGGANPKTSSISIVSAPGGDPAAATLMGSVYQGQPPGIDALLHVGDTHPSASAIVRRGSEEVLYVCKANTDAIGLILADNGRKLPDFDLSPIRLTLADGHSIHGAYPNAIVVSPDSTRAYVAEAGINSVAVLDTTSPSAPKLLGRIPTGWYPTALSLSSDARTLYIVNAKGIGQDVNPKTMPGTHAPTGTEAFSDTNYLFGTVQRVDLARHRLNNRIVLANNYRLNRPADTSVVPAGGSASTRIKHVFFILQENKTFDSELGGLGKHFGAFASTTFNDRTGAIASDGQFTGVTSNLQLLARTFAAGVNYYSDSEESDAGHQFAASGTATDYTEKTLLNKAGRGLLVNKNFEPEDYPEGGYLYNNAARNGVSFRLYGLEAARIVGSDTGAGMPTLVNDPISGLAGLPRLAAPDAITKPLANLGDVTSPTGKGVGQSFFMKMPGLAVVGTNNPNGTGRLDKFYPGYNFNISDQRRALEFCGDFDRMAAAGTLPQFLYIYLPNSHTGGTQAPNRVAVGGATGPQQVGDSDVALGMIVQHIMASPIYYNRADGTGSVIITAPDDAQSTLDHIHPHRSPLVVVSPYAKPGYVAKRHYSTASIVKTEELLLGLPPNNLGDLLATDLRDMFQPTYNGITLAASVFSRTCRYVPSLEGSRIWALVNRLDNSGPDRDSKRLGVLTRLSMAADARHRDAARKGRLHTSSYRQAQSRLYRSALAIANGPASPDND